MKLLRWSLKIALQNMRGNAWQSFFFVLMTTITVASFFSISLVRQAIFETIQSESRSILGSDLLIEGKKPLDSIDSELDIPAIESYARVSEFRSMVRLKQGQDTSFAQVVALEPSYPFYGNIDIDPANSWARLDEANVALVDKQLFVSHALSIGEEISVGEANFEIVGVVSLLPGDSSLRAMIAPRVYIPFQAIERTTLDTTGSWASHKRYIKLQNSLPTVIPKEISAIAERETLRVRTPQSREDQLSDVVDTVYLFLSLVTLLAAILATIGVVTSMQAYAKANRKVVAVLRCLGATKPAILTANLLQSLTIATIGLAAGLLIGWQFASILLSAVAKFFAFSPNLKIEPILILQGAAVASTVSFSSFLLFYAEWKNFEPTEALRLGQGATPNAKRGSIVLLLIVSLCILTYGVIIAATDLRLYAAILVIIAFISILLMASSLLRRAVSNINISNCSFATRFGIRNIKSSSSLSQLLMIALGLSVSLAVATVIISDSFSKLLDLPTDKSQANTLLFDIQTDQLQTVRNSIEGQGLTVLESAPMVSMKLIAVNGKSVSEIIPTTPQDEQWAYLREYKSSYRDTLKSDETLIEGQITKTFQGSLDGIIPITLEQRIAERLNIWTDAELVFDVQGLKLSTKVVGIRKANWRRMSPNVFVLFPTGVLENAPQMNIFTTHVGSEEQFASLSKAIVNVAPNVSVIDLRSILQVVSTVAEMTLFAVTLLSLFILSIALLCIIQAIASSSNANANEEKTLFTIGAQSKVINKIKTVEITTLSIVAATTGLFLGSIGGGLVTKHLLNIGPSYDPVTIILVPTFAVFFAVTTSKLSNNTF